MRSFYQTSTLKRLIRSGDFPAEVQGIVSWARAQLDSTYRGTLMEENELAAADGSWSLKTSDAQPSRTMQELTTLRASALQSVSSMSKRKEIFQAFDRLTPGAQTAPGNCVVHFKRDDALVPAIIREIVQRRDSEDGDILLRVGIYDELSSEDLAKDIYRTWSGLDCHLRYQSVTDEQLIRPSDIVSHAARCSYTAVHPANQPSKPVFVFVGLDRVSAASF